MDTLYTVADFESTTEVESKEETAVWSAALIDLFVNATEPENVHIDLDIGHFMDTIFQFEGKRRIVYFQNLKFDGSFIIDYIVNNTRLIYLPTTRTSRMQDGCYTTLISADNEWYSIVIKKGHKTVVFQDSMKLLPFSVLKIGKDFKTKYQKLEMDYTGQKPGQPIPKDKIPYIQNDVLVMKEAMELMLSEGHDKMTIGACCLSEYIKMFQEEYKCKFRSIFPDLSKISDESGTYSSVDEYIRKAYKGGWCYVKRGCENKIYHNGTTCDVNSLYPSMMQSESGNYYPYGKPYYFKGELEQYIKDNFYYFVRVKCAFELKAEHLPTIQVKGDFHYPHNLWLEKSSSVMNGIYDKKLREVEMVMTMTDYELMHEHYHVYNEEIIDGYYFTKEIGFFDKYINKWAEVKMREKGAKRQIAKLFLNNLYGKFATGKCSSYKVPTCDDSGIVKYLIKEEYNKTPIYIPVGAAITSYARNFTIRAAQKNYECFIYADTDSIHCCCGPDEIKGAPEDPVKFNHWKYESCWDEAIFVRQKTYIEHITHENREECEPHYDVKCAGMGKGPKSIFEKGLNEGKYTLADFKIGLELPGNLKAKRVKGGTILMENTYKLR